MTAVVIVGRISCHHRSKVPFVCHDPEASLNKCKFQRAFAISFTPCSPLCLFHLLSSFPSHGSISQSIFTWSVIQQKDKQGFHIPNHILKLTLYRILDETQIVHCRLTSRRHRGFYWLLIGFRPPWAQYERGMKIKPLRTFDPCCL